MADPFVAQILAVGFNFAPAGWAICQGQILSISQNTALFSLVGTYYGGNGTSNFGLPNLQGRVPIHQGTLAGGSQYVLGEIGGEENHTLITSELPMHPHSFLCDAAPGGTTSPAGASPARLNGGTPYLAAPTSLNTNLAPNMIGLTGNGLPHANIQPYIALNYIIALQGVYPARN